MLRFLAKLVGQRKRVLSTREEIIAHIKRTDLTAPPASMSAEEMQALIAKRKFRVEELSPVPEKELAYERPLSSSDSPKNVAFGMSERDRNFWFNLVIGCSGPDSTSQTVVGSNGFRSRNAAKLAYAMADVKRLRNLVSGHVTMAPDRVFPRGYRLTAGNFHETLYLTEATSSDLDGAFAALRSFFEKNEDDPEWDGGQVNFFFAGHGANRHAALPIDRGGLCLKDTVIGAQEMQHKLMNTLPRSVRQKWYGLSFPGNCRIDMYLDCCYSGQFVAAFVGRLLEDCKGLVPGKFWCSSMPFQKSFEIDAMQHGVFTSHFLSGNSSKEPLTFPRSVFPAGNPSLKAGDVGKNTGNQQSPFVLDFSNFSPETDFFLTIPGAVGTNAVLREVPLPSDVLGAGFARWLPDYLEAVYRKNWSKAI